jgi:integrase
MTERQGDSMTAHWKATKYPGVRFREHPTRKHGIKRDQYFAVRYQKDGHRQEEGLGWLSEGWSAQRAYEKLAELKRTGSTLAEQRKAARAVKEEARQAEERARLEAMTFSDFVTGHYFPQAQHDKKTKTARTEEQLHRLHIEPVIGSRTFSEIAPIHLEKIKQTMADKSPRTVAYALAVVRQVFNFARIRGVFLGPNPVRDVKKPSADNRRMRFLTHEEAGRLMGELAIRSRTLHDTAMLSLQCGLRASEIFSLEWQDVDFLKGQLYVRDPKNKHNRWAIMTGEVHKMLNGRKPHGNACGLVFRDRRHGEAIKEVSRAFDRVVQDLGLNDGITDRRLKLVFHSLRHTYASWLVAAGTHLFVVKELMGHRSLAMTERYSHVSNDSLRAAVNGLEKALKAGGHHE